MQPRIINFLFFGGLSIIRPLPSFRPCAFSPSLCLVSSASMNVCVRSVCSRSAVCCRTKKADFRFHLLPSFLPCCRQAAAPRLVVHGRPPARRDVPADLRGHGQERTHHQGWPDGQALSRRAGGQSEIRLSMLPTSSNILHHFNSWLVQLPISE